MFKNFLAAVTYPVCVDDIWFDRIKNHQDPAFISNTLDTVIPIQWLPPDRILADMYRTISLRRIRHSKYCYARSVYFRRYRTRWYSLIVERLMRQ